MLVAFEANKDICKKLFVFNVSELEKDLKIGSDIYCESPPVRFRTPECAQFVADAYDIPVCVYTDPSSKAVSNESLTFLPIKTSAKLKVKVQPLILQNFGNIYWFAVKLGHLQTMYPPIQHLYFKIDESYRTLFKTTWNIFGQFPKHKENKQVNPETIEYVDISSSDEE